MWNSPMGIAEIKEYKDTEEEVRREDGLWKEVQRARKKYVRRPNCSSRVLSPMVASPNVRRPNCSSRVLSPTVASPRCSEWFT